MKTTLAAPNLTASEHIYLLVHSEGRFFKVTRCGDAKRRALILKSEPADIDKSIVFQYLSSVDVVLAIRLLRARLMAQKCEKISGSIWYDIAALPDLLARPYDPGQKIPVEICSLRVFRPSDSCALAALTNAEKEIKEARANAEAYERDLVSQKRRVDAAAAQEEQERDQLAAYRKKITDIVAAGEYISPMHRPAYLITRIETMLAALNQYSNGYCRIYPWEDGKFEVHIWSRNKVDAEMRRISKELQRVVFFKEEPMLVTDVAEMEANFPFKQLVHQFRRCEPGMKLYSFEIRPAWRAELAILKELKPEVRGWDLPANAKIWGYDPAKDKEFKAIVSGLPKPRQKRCAVRALWNSASRSGVPLVRDYLRKSGLVLDWEPKSIRFLANSPMEGDDGGPLLLLALTDNEGQMVGFQKIRLNSGHRELVPFKDADISRAIIRLWAYKETLFVATCFEDAVALNSVTHLPCVIVPSYSALEKMELSGEIAQIQLCLPRANEEQWVRAASTLAARAKMEHIGVVAYVPEETEFRSYLPVPAEWTVALNGGLKFEEIVAVAVPLLAVLPDEQS